MTHSRSSEDWAAPKPARTANASAPEPWGGAVPRPPDSEPYIETTVFPIDELGPGPSLALGPARTTSMGPAPEPPVDNPYAVTEDEATLFDYHPRSDPKPDTPRMVPVHVRGLSPAALAALTVPRPAASYDEWHRLQSLVDPRLVLSSEPESERAASFRLLRDNLLGKGCPRIIAVASGAANEGKTTCAINLALALSERPSVRVLLLEGNFAAPALDSVFQIDASTPAARHLDLPWLEPYRVVEIAPGLDVAALLRTREGAPPPFNSRWFPLALGHLSGAGYDFLVIDAAALDGNAAVLQVIGAADGTLLTVRSKGSTARTFRRAADQIPKGRALGVALVEG